MLTVSFCYLCCQEYQDPRSLPTLLLSGEEKFRECPGATSPRSTGILFSTSKATVQRRGGRPMQLNRAGQVDLVPKFIENLLHSARLDVVPFKRTMLLESDLLLHAVGYMGTF